MLEIFRQVPADVVRCCDQLAEGVSRCVFGVGFPFSEENPVPDGVKFQTLVPIESGVVLEDVDGQLQTFYI